MAYWEYSTNKTFAFTWNKRFREVWDEYDDIIDGQPQNAKDIFGQRANLGELRSKISRIAYE